MVIRVLSPAMIAIMRKPVKRMATFVHVAASTPINVWNGLGYYTNGGRTYGGVGAYGVVNGLSSERSSSTQRVSLSLMVPPEALETESIIAEARALTIKGAAVEIMISFTHVDTDIPMLPPELIWRGVADYMQFQLGEPIVSTLVADGFSGKLRRSNALRMTTVSHNQRIGNPAIKDTFFDFNRRLNARNQTPT